MPGETWRRKTDQDWQGEKKQRGLEESCKSLIVSSLMEEWKEEKNSLLNLSVTNSSLTDLYLDSDELSLVDKLEHHFGKQTLVFS